jgi:hypothetical protein
VLPRRLVAGAVVFGLLLVGVLTAQMLMIEDQRSTTDAQLRTAVRQANAGLPLLEDAQPLVEGIAQSRPQLERFGRDANVLLKELTPLASELRDARADEQLEATGALARQLLEADAGRQLRATGALASQLLDADAPGATRAVRQLAVTLLEADLSGAANDLGRLTNELLKQQRLRRLLVRSNAVLGEVRARNLVPKATRAAEETAKGFPRTIALQEELLRTQKLALVAIQETLAVARETERHAENLDRKTGGPAPTAAGTPTP